jgi:predicted NUDIX family phosphoesterase
MRVETVLCLETSAVSGRLVSTGFIPTGQSEADEFLTSGDSWFAPRNIIEHREDYRQVIPYVILRHNDAVVLYRRTPKGGESRLHGLYSMGFGGHVGLGDVVLNGDALDVRSTLEHAVLRELDEEVRHAPVTGREVIGLIYDDKDAVSRVHLGLVQIWDIAEPYATSAEDAVAECALIPIADLPGYLDRMEGWSRLCADFISSQR